LFGVVFWLNREEGVGRAGDRAKLSNCSFGGNSSGLSDDSPRCHLSALLLGDCHVDFDSFAVPPADLSAVSNEASEVA
jgi:hypothetical protein